LTFIATHRELSAFKYVSSSAPAVLNRGRSQRLRSKAVLALMVQANQDDNGEEDENNGGDSDSELTDIDTLDFDI
jgi:hypothetical protein